MNKDIENVYDLIADEKFEHFQDSEKFEILRKF